MARPRWRGLTPVQRLIERSEYLPDGCLVVRAGLNNVGYGQIQIDGHKQLVHRLAYELFVGPIPEGLQIDHLCRNRACWRWDHLEAVTSRENTLRGQGITARCAKVTHCPRGHEYAGENLYVSPRGKRFCRACRPITLGERAA